MIFVAFSATACGAQKSDSPSTTPSTPSTTAPSTPSTDTSTPATTPAKALFSSDYAFACNGIAVNGAAAYQKTAGVHPAIVLSRDSAEETYYERTSVLPAGWSVNWKELAKTELAACVDITSSSLVETCKFDIKGDAYDLEIYNATYEFKLYEAATGKEIAKKQVDVKMDKCPSMHMFSNKLEKDYPDFNQPLIEFLKPFVQVS